MGVSKIASDFMDSAMNIERLIMGEIVGKMMEPFPIKISNGPTKPCTFLLESGTFLTVWV